MSHLESEFSIENMLFLSEVIQLQAFLIEEKILPPNLAVATKHEKGLETTEINKNHLPMLHMNIESTSATSSNKIMTLESLTLDSLQLTPTSVSNDSNELHLNVLNSKSFKYLNYKLPDQVPKSPFIENIKILRNDHNCDSNTNGNGPKNGLENEIETETETEKQRHICNFVGLQVFGQLYLKYIESGKAELEINISGRVRDSLKQDYIKFKDIEYCWTTDEIMQWWNHLVLAAKEIARLLESAATRCDYQI